MAKNRAELRDGLKAEWVTVGKSRLLLASDTFKINLLLQPDPDSCRDIIGTHGMTVQMRLPVLIHRREAPMPG
jgi:hypothetical protein